MKRAIERGARIAERRVETLAAQVEGRAREMPGVEVSREGGRVVLRGRGLLRRMIADVRWRWTGAWR